MGWKIPAPGKSGSRNLAGSGHAASATVGAVPVVIPLSQSGSSSFPGCLPLSPLLPDTQHCSSSVSQVLLAGFKGEEGLPPWRRAGYSFSIKSSVGGFARKVLLKTSQSCAAEATVVIKITLIMWIICWSEPRLQSHLCESS